MLNEGIVQVKEKTNPKVAFFYSLGDAASLLSWYMINSYLTLFYTDIVGLAASAISMILLVARVIDTAFDPIMGIIADRTNTRWGKFRPYIMFGPPFLAIFNILTFTVFPVTGAFKIILCLVCYTVCGMFYSLCNLPYNSLVNVIAKDSKVRMNLLTVRGVVNSIFSIALAAFVMPMILFFGNSNVATSKGYLITNIILSIAMVIMFWLSAAYSKETYTAELHADIKSEEKVGIVKSLKGLIKNDQLTIVIFSIFFGAVAVMGRMGLLAFYVIYVVGSYQAIALVFTVMTIAQLVGNMTLPFGVKFFGKKGYLFILNGMMIASFLILYMFPINNIPFILIVSFFAGMPNCLSFLGYGMLTDCIEYGDFKLGIRQEGLANSFLSLGVKFATAICGSIGILLLSATGYVPNMEQTEAAKHGINFVVNVVPAIFIVISTVPMFFYKLDSKRVNEISEELSKRKSKISE